MSEIKGKIQSSTGKLATKHKLIVLNFENRLLLQTNIHSYRLITDQIEPKHADTHQIEAFGPVLLNYGLEECRFTKPVYPGMTIGVRLTVKEKIAQEQRDENDVPKGIVKWLVEVFDQANETVAIANILTMVRKVETLKS